MSRSPRHPSSVNSLNHSFNGANPSTSNANANASQDNMQSEMATVEQLILQLRDRDLRENALKALLDLSRKREIFHNLGPLLWDSFGTITVLLQEIVSVYPVLSPPTLTLGASNRVCNAVLLLMCVALHQETRASFLSGTLPIILLDIFNWSPTEIANIPLYLYPILNTKWYTKPFQNLRLCSLGVIHAFVKVDDTEAVKFFLPTGIIDLCLPIMKMDTELSKIEATRIVQNIISNDMGLDFICRSGELSFSLFRALGTMVQPLKGQPSRLLRFIILCYLRLSENPSACKSLSLFLPGMLSDSTFNNCLREDQYAYLALQQLLRNVYGADHQWT